MRGCSRREWGVMTRECGSGLLLFDGVWEPDGGCETPWVSKWAKRGRLSNPTTSYRTASRRRRLGGRTPPGSAKPGFSVLRRTRFAFGVGVGDLPSCCPLRSVPLGFFDACFPRHHTPSGSLAFRLCSCAASRCCAPPFVLEKKVLKNKALRSPRRTA
ncbi:hypothetical protein GQ53DRAFT_218722 [Thozetella sp. PMI_491]|nr:hypothetical protein GQ53DRAFT_218722 [Thozetella sp. PMI_491]